MIAVELSESSARTTTADASASTAVQSAEVFIIAERPGGTGEGEE
jgi:hypothetical protein